MDTPACVVPALEFSHIQKSYGSTPVLNDVSFSVASGSIMALLGPNGAGKTTTIEIAEGFIQPDSGTLSLLGLDPTTEPDKVRSSVGIMLQDGGAFPGITVEEMLKLTAAYYTSPHDVEWLLDLLDLTHVRKSTYRHLSGGQKQRLSFANAIIGRPRLVFLDEPSAGLDTRGKHDIWNIINALKRDGVTIILSTHLMEEAELLADTINILDQGKIVAHGTPHQLTNTAPNTAQLTLKATEEAISAFINTLPSPFTLGGIDYSRVVTVNHQGDITPEALSELVNHARNTNVLIRQFSIGKESLEDTFLDITGRK